MKVRNIKTNYVLNLSRLLLSTGVSLITMPYVNKTLGSTYIGKVEYVNAIVNYFILFSALGIPAYGIREIARIREDKILRTKVLLELMIILFITTFISYLIIYVLLFSFGIFLDVKTLLILMSTGIFLSNIGVEWFYQGIEDQLYISIRHIFIKIVTIILLLFFVKVKDDYIIYGGIMIFSTYGGNVFNLIYLKKFICIHQIKWNNIDIKSHVRPICIIFIATASVSIYTQINIIILKYFTKEEFVGYYTQADKLSRITLVFITSLGAVMLPRLTYLIGNGAMKEYARYAEKSFKFILLVSIPICILFIIYSKEIVSLMAGPDFLPSVFTLKITSLNIFIVGLAYFFGFQVLYPLNKEKIYTISVSVGAIISLIINLLIISRFKHNGVAFSSVLAEVIGVLLMYFMSRKGLRHIGIKILEWGNLKFFITIIIFFPIFFLVNSFQLSDLLTVVIGGSISLILYFLSLLLMKESLITEIWKKIKNNF